DNTTTPHDTPTHDPAPEQAPPTPDRPPIDSPAPPPRTTDEPVTPNDTPAPGHPDDLTGITPPRTDDAANLPATRSEDTVRLDGGRGAEPPPAAPVATSPDRPAGLPARLGEPDTMADKHAGLGSSAEQAATAGAREAESMRPADSAGQSTADAGPESR